MRMADNTNQTLSGTQGQLVRQGWGGGGRVEGATTTTTITCKPAHTPAHADHMHISQHMVTTVRPYLGARGVQTPAAGQSAASSELRPLQEACTSTHHHQQQQHGHTGHRRYKGSAKSPLNTLARVTCKPGQSAGSGACQDHHGAAPGAHAIHQRLHNAVSAPAPGNWIGRQSQRCPVQQMTGGEAATGSLDATH